MSTTTAVRPVTDRQSAFIRKLVDERDYSSHVILGAEGAKPITEESIAGLSQSGASVIIEWLLESPRKPLVHEDGEAVGEGYYLLLDTVYKVVPAKHSGNVYAKELVIDEGRASWEYARGAMKLLTAAHRMTIEQAREIGHLHGICAVCAKQLTNPASVEAGIGPVCATRL